MCIAFDWIETCFDELEEDCQDVKDATNRSRRYVIVDNLEERALVSLAMLDSNTFREVSTYGQLLFSKGEFIGYKIFFYAWRNLSRVSLIIYGGASVALCSVPAIIAAIASDIFAETQTKGKCRGKVEKAQCLKGYPVMLIDYLNFITSHCSMFSFKGIPYWMTPEVLKSCMGN
ncbi:hypothetical protein GIB67_020546 [Kingdonia uniflora]|uniref:Uncharacterized protein n=1 Tax=Kingdonia uniflora TaxID=39325 RepID=A0A7J7NLH6_9MAGN|nr:hypothetical protein GIB67_020546 [Kingdonia uniflora]